MYIEIFIYDIRKIYKKYEIYPGARASQHSCGHAFCLSHIYVYISYLYRIYKIYEIYRIYKIYKKIRNI